MTFTDAVRTCFNKYATFNGTASRSEYWWFYLFCFLVTIALSFLGDAAALIFVVGTFLPSIAVAVRRLHDTDRSGWLLLLQLIPLIGALIVLVFLVQNTRPNRYAAPETAPAAAAI